MRELYFYGETFPSKKKKSRRVTVAGLVGEDGATRIGWAMCSEKDPFEKRIGRSKATGRALSKQAITVNLKKEEFTNEFIKVAKAIISKL